LKNEVSFILGDAAWIVSSRFLIWTWSLHPSWETVSVEWITVNSEMKILRLEIHWKRIYVSHFNVHKFYNNHVTKQPTRTERPEPSDPWWHHRAQNSLTRVKHQYQFSDPHVSFISVPTDGSEWWNLVRITGIFRTHVSFKERVFL
jgi:hypothetical protein